MPPALSGSQQAETSRAQQAVRNGRRSWGLMALGAVLFIAAILLFWWGLRHLPHRVEIIDDKYMVRTPPSRPVENTQAPASIPRPEVAPEPKTSVPGSTFRQHASTQVAAERLYTDDHAKQTPEIILSAAPTPQASPPRPAATPTTRCARLGSKPNLFRRIANSILRLFKKNQPEYLTNEPPTVSLSASSGTITLPCPPGITTVYCTPSSSQTVQLAANATDPDGDTLLYTYTTTGGRVTGDGANTSWDLTGVQPGTYTATVEVDDGCGCVAFSSTTVTVGHCDCLLPCPNVSISCPTDQVQAGTPAMVSVSLSGGDPNASPTYNWSVSAGTITGGQGTPSITIDTTGLSGQNVTATVEIGGLPPECQRTASCSFSVAAPPAPPECRKFDGYSGLKLSDEEAYLGNFAIQLQQEPGSQGYYVIWGSCEGEADQRSARAVDYLVNNRGIDRGRITVVNGGCRETLTVELWICPMGAAAPTPNNSATVTPCPECKAKPRGRRGSGGISGTVLDQKNKPVPGASVVAIDKNGNQSEPVFTDPNGKFTITGLLPGEYTLRVIYKGVSRQLSVSVPPNQITPISSIALPIDVTTITPEASSLIVREADQIKVTYPDKFLTGTESKVTFDLERVLREVVQSQTLNANTGTVEIIDKPRALQGAIDNTISPAINEGDYDTYVRVQLSATGLIVPPEQAVQEKLYSRANQETNRKLREEWTWSLSPASGRVGQAELRFQVTVIWKSKNPAAYPDITHLDAWQRVIQVSIGESVLLVYGSTYGSPIVAIGAFGAFGIGVKKRKKLLAGEVEEEGIEAQRSMAATQLPRVAAREEVEDEVTGTVYAPGRVHPGDGFLVQVFLHLPEQAASLEEMAKEFDEDARKADYARLREKIKRGTELTLFLEMPGLDIDDPVQSCVWQGEAERVRFGVTVPEGFQPKDILSKVTVAENSIPVGHLKFKIKIVSAAQGEADASSAQAVPVGNLNRYKQAFISYASGDRQEVTKRVQMLNLVKIKFFQDLLTLEPGEPFEKLIYQYIDQSDVFFLFWSAEASQSKWVMKEVEYAIQRKAANEEAPPEIVPVIIEGPPPAKPPTELSFLHFNDKFIYFINTRETEASPDNI